MVKAEVYEKTSPLLFKVKWNSGQVVHGYVDHIHKGDSSTSVTPDNNTEELSVENMDIAIVALLTDTILVEFSTDKSEHPAEVGNPQKCATRSTKCGPSEHVR